MDTQNSHGFLRISGLLEILMDSRDSYGFLGVLTDSYGFLKIPVDSCGFLWTPRIFCGFLEFPIATNIS